MQLAATEALPNPKPADARLARERASSSSRPSAVRVTARAGLGDGPVAGPPFGKGPFVGVLPIAGPVGSQITKNFSDGHIYTVISQGVRRMPATGASRRDHRWDIVNYVRYLNGCGARRHADRAGAGSAAGRVLTP